MPVRIEGSGRSYFGRLAGIYPRKLLPEIRITIQPRRHDSDARSCLRAKLRRRRAGELMRRILLDMLVATRPAAHPVRRRSWMRKSTFGAHYKLVEDVRMEEEIVRLAAAHGAGSGAAAEPRSPTPDEIVGVLTPNAAPTLGLILGLVRGEADSRHAQLHGGRRRAAGRLHRRRASRNIVASRAFIEKARLTSPLVELSRASRCIYLEDLRDAVGLRDKLWILLAPVLPGMR